MNLRWSWEEALARTTREGLFVGQAELAQIYVGLPPSLLHSARPDVLRVRPQEEGPQGTFTSHHGFGQFPWHSDGAIADHPPRFILLSAPIASRTPTELIRLRQGVPMLEALRGLVLITRLRRPRYFRAVDVTSGLTRVRWDPDKLSVVSPPPRSPEIVVPSPDIQIEWRVNTVALIDNWQCLHRRPRVPKADRGRVLLRSYIHERRSDV